MPGQENLLSSLKKSPDQPETLVESIELEGLGGRLNKGLNFRPLLRTARRNIFLISSVTTLVALLSAYIALSTPKKFSGNFQLLVEPATSEAKLTDPTVISRDASNTNTDSSVDYETLIRVLKSRSLLSKVTKEIRSRYPDVTYNVLSQGLQIQQVGDTELQKSRIIEISYSDGNPQKLLFVLEIVAKEYLTYSLEDRKSRIGGGVQFIEQQLPGLELRVNRIEDKLQVFQQQHKLSDPTAGGTNLSEQARTIETQRQDAQKELQAQRALYTNLRNQLGIAPEEAITASSLSEDPRYQDLLSQLQKIETEIAVTSAQVTPENPVLQTLQEQRQNLLSLLNQRTQQVVGKSLTGTLKNPQELALKSSVRQSLNQQLVDTANSIKVLETRYRATAQAEAVLDQQVQQFPGVLRQYNDLKRQLDVATTTLNQLLLQRETLRVEAAQKAIPWRVVSDPDLVRDPSGIPIPDTDGGIKKKLAMGVVAGFLLGLGIALIRENNRNVFLSIEDIRESIELPILQVIPFRESAQKVAIPSNDHRAEERSVSHFIDSPFFDAFDSLYTSIHFLASKPVRALVVSSALSADGKTTIAMNLAQAAAAMGERVLLVDANLHSPQVHNRLGLDNHQGLSNVFRLNRDVNSVIKRWPTDENLSVLTAGPKLQSNPTRLLGSAKMQNLMQELHENFDLVVYDAPCLDGLPDANFLAANTDGVLMVIGVAKTKRSAVMQVLNQLNKFRLPVLGLVVNSSKEHREGSQAQRNHYYQQNGYEHLTLERESELAKAALPKLAKQSNDKL